VARRARRGSIFQPLIVMAKNGHAIKRHAINEIQKRLLHISHIAIAIHVLAIDICYRGQDRRQLKE
jgi:hypothetical protein